MTRLASPRLGCLAERERDLELATRSVACPTCGATPGQPCTYGRTKPRRNDSAAQIKRGPVSHTGRYEVAATAGLVPALRDWQQSGGQQ